MMMLTEEGVDRQQAHAVIRKTALEAKQLQATQKVDIRQTMADPFFDSVRFYYYFFKLNYYLIKIQFFILLQTRRTKYSSQNKTINNFQVRDRVVGLVNNPINFTGRCVSQTESFIAKELKPTIDKYLDKSAGNVQLDV